MFLRLLKNRYEIILLKMVQNDPFNAVGFFCFLNRIWEFLVPNVHVGNADCDAPASLLIIFDAGTWNEEKRFDAGAWERGIDQIIAKAIDY